jgi:hypothetical protein
MDSQKFLQRYFFFEESSYFKKNHKKVTIFDPGYGVYVLPPMV